LMQNPKLWVFWSWCLMKASRKKTKQLIGAQMVELNPGDFIFGRKNASTQLKISEQTIRTCVKTLEKMQNIRIVPTNKFTIISVINWDSYQSNNREANHQLTSNQPATNQQTTNKLTSGTNGLDSSTGEKKHDTFHESSKINHKQEDKKTRRQEKEKPPLTPQGEKPKPTKSELKKYLIQKIESEGFLDIKDQIILFFEYRMAKPKKQQYQTEKGINGLFRNLGGCQNAALNTADCLEIAMENNWQTAKPGYYNDLRGGIPGQPPARFPNGTVMGSKRMDSNLAACQQFIERKKNEQQ